jgi:hypothetical protein
VQLLLAVRQERSVFPDISQRQSIILPTAFAKSEIYALSNPK